MTHRLGSYSDWRTIAPVEICPQCGGTRLRSRDCPKGLEVECLAGCGYHEVLTDLSREDFQQWLQKVRSLRGS